MPLRRVAAGRARGRTNGVIRRLVLQIDAPAAGQRRPSTAAATAAPSLVALITRLEATGSPAASSVAPIGAAQVGDQGVGAFDRAVRDHDALRVHLRQRERRSRAPHRRHRAASRPAPAGSIPLRPQQRDHAVDVGVRREASPSRNEITLAAPTSARVVARRSRRSPSARSLCGAVTFQPSKFSRASAKRKAEVVGRELEPFVRQRNARRARERGEDLRRTRVRDRLPDHREALRHGPAEAPALGPTQLLQLREERRMRDRDARRILDRHRARSRPAPRSRTPSPTGDRRRSATVPPCSAPAASRRSRRRPRSTAPPSSRRPRTSTAMRSLSFTRSSRAPRTVVVPFA